VARLLSDRKFAVTGRLLGVDNTGLVGPMFTLRIPATSCDIRRPGSYLDFVLLDANRKTLTRQISIDDKLVVVLHFATANISKGTRNEMAFHIEPRNKCRRISYCKRVFEAYDPVNGKVIENDGNHIIAVDAGVPVVVSLLQHKPAQTKQIKLNSWVTFWPAPPVHGLILGKA